MAVLQAQREGLRNFSMLVSHVLVPPAIRLLLESPANRVQGFIAPGHVCAVMGYWEYAALSRQYRVPIVVGGFEPVDLIEAIGMLVAQLEEGRAEAENQYARAVTLEGNRIAQKVLLEVSRWSTAVARALAPSHKAVSVCVPSSPNTTPRESSVWRTAAIGEPAECIAAQVLQGLKKPVDWPRLRRPLHARKPAGSAHGFRRGCLRRVLSVPP